MDGGQDTDIVDNMIETIDDVDIENQYGGYDPAIDDMIKEYKKTLINIKQYLYDNFTDYIDNNNLNNISIMKEWCILLSDWYTILKKGADFEISELYNIDINEQLIDNDILILLDKLKSLYYKIESEYHIELDDFLKRVFKTYPYGMNEKSII